MKKYFQQNVPSSLVNSRRYNNGQINMIKGIRPPKRRFNIGERFLYEETVWEIIYMYRLKDNPHEWYHCLEERRELTVTAKLLKNVFEVGTTTSRIVYDCFRSYDDVQQYFSDIYRSGDGITKTTQELLKIRKV